MLFDDVVVGHIGWIARVAFRFCKNKADADDLAQETLFRIYANSEKFNNARDFKPWALTIMTNIVKTQYARKKNIPFISIDEDFDAQSGVSSESLANYNDVWNAIHRSARVSIGVQCVVLYAEGYSYDEIAEMAGIKPGTVKSRIAAGRAAIKEALGVYLS